jgi:hypothetical protein
MARVLHHKSLQVCLLTDQAWFTACMGVFNAVYLVRCYDAVCASVSCVVPVTLLASCVVLVYTLSVLYCACYTLSVSCTVLLHSECVLYSAVTL